MAACLVCGTTISARYTGTTCKTSCRVVLHNRRKKARQDAAINLLLRHTRAVQDSDGDALEAIAREAETLLGDAK